MAASVADTAVDIQCRRCIRYLAVASMAVADSAVAASMAVAVDAKWAAAYTQRELADGWFPL